MLFRSYWEGVYGQPLHIYPKTKPGPHGTWVEMPDDEHVELVRPEVYKRTRERAREQQQARKRMKHVQEEKHTRQDEERTGQDEERARREEQEARARREADEVHRRHARRQRAERAKASWKEYTQRWDDLKDQHSTLAHLNARELIPWPVDSGRSSDVSEREIIRFFRGSTAWEYNATALLKMERVRWHPDKMQQRFRHHIDPDTDRKSVV